MSLRILAVVLAAIATVWGAIPAAAQGTPVAVEAGVDWVHGPSGIVVPVEIEGFARGEARDLTTSLHDVIIQYGRPDDDTFATLYIYRTGYRDLSVWFNQAYRSMRNNPVVGLRAGDERRPDLVALTGDDTPDTGIVAFDIDGDYRTTGLGLTERNGWLVKVRISSGTLDREQNRALIRSFLAGLALPERVGDAALPAELADCAEHVPDAAAEPVTSPAPETAVFGPMMIGIVISEARSGACFDAELAPLIGVYHPQGQLAPYIVALGDSGKAAYVTPLPAELAGDAWIVVLLVADRGIVAGYFETRPSPQQAADAAMGILTGRNPGLGSLIYPQGDEGPIVNIGRDMLRPENE